MAKEGNTYREYLSHGQCSVHQATQLNFESFKVLTPLLPGKPWSVPYCSESIESDPIDSALLIPRNNSTPVPIGPASQALHFKLEPAFPFKPVTQG